MKKSSNQQSTNTAGLNCGEAFRFVGENTNKGGKLMKTLSTRLIISGFRSCIARASFFVFSLVALMLSFSNAHAQAPHISYTSPQVYTASVAINPLSPTNSGGAVPLPSPGTFSETTFTSVAVDASGNVYVGSTENAYLKITEFLAGGGSKDLAEGFNVNGLAVDGAGNVYFIEANNTINKIAAGTGVITNIATDKRQPHGIAVDAAGNLFYCASAIGEIKKIPAGSNTPVIIASGFGSPIGITLDASGNIYVADHGLNTVEKIAAGSGMVVTLATGGANSQVDGVAVDAFGNVYFISDNNTTITEIPVGGGSNVVISSGFTNTQCMAIDTQGDFFIGNQLNTGPFQYLSAGGYKISPLPPAGISLSTRTGVISGTPTAASPATNYKVIAEGTDTAVVNIKVVAGSNKSLTHLTINHGKFSPAYNVSTTAYGDTVAGAVTSVSLTPTLSGGGATVTINGTTVASGTASPAIPLPVGVTGVHIVVDSATTEDDYTVNVTRGPSPAANLSSLKISRGTLTPAFNSGVISYTASVANGVTSMTVTPTATYTGTTITVNGVTVASGSASPALPLNVGTNGSTTTATASDGITTKTYTLTVTRAGGVNANLSSLKVSRGELSPVFNAGTTSYTASVVNGVTAMTVTPTSADPDATIKVNGSAVTSGTASQAIALAVGENTVSTVITASNGSTTKTYTVTVTRASGEADSFNPGIIVGVQNFEPLQHDDGVVVHQAVSPNGDGINDFLQIDGIQAYPDNKLTIMNRSGQIITQTSGYDNTTKTFDGHSNKNGQLQLPGTYFYELDYTVKGITKTKTGFIVLKY